MFVYTYLNTYKLIAEKWETKHGNKVLCTRSYHVNAMHQVNSNSTMLHMYFTRHTVYDQKCNIRSTCSVADICALHNAFCVIAAHASGTGALDWLATGSCDKHWNFINVITEQTQTQAET